MEAHDSVMQLLATAQAKATSNREVAESNADSAAALAAAARSQRNAAGAIDMTDIPTLRQSMGEPGTPRTPRFDGLEQHGSGPVSPRRAVNGGMQAYGVRFVIRAINELKPHKFQFPQPSQQQT